VFFVIYSLAPRGENVTVDDLKGLYRRAPLLAFTLAVGAFGLAGIPPTAGFAGKFFVLTAALEKGYLALVIIAALNTAVGIFYYLKMVRSAYSPEEEAATPVSSVPLSLLGRTSDTPSASRSSSSAPSPVRSWASSARPWPGWAEPHIHAAPRLATRP